MDLATRVLDPACHARSPPLIGSGQAAGHRLGQAAGWACDGGSRPERDSRRQRYRHRLRAAIHPERRWGQFGHPRSSVLSSASALFRGNNFWYVVRLTPGSRGRDNQMVAQMSLFSRAEVAGMRDRTLARNYSAEREEFRREHERHRAWGLRQRHARKLVRAGWGASAAWAAVTAGEDQQRQAVSVVSVPPQPVDPGPSPLAPVAAPSAGQAAGEVPPSSELAPPPAPPPAPETASRLAPPPAPQFAPRSTAQPAPRLAPWTAPWPAPQRAPLPAAQPTPQRAPETAPPSTAQPAPPLAPPSTAQPAPPLAPLPAAQPAPQRVAGSSSPVSFRLGDGRGRAGLFIVLVGWCVMVVKVALDKVGCRRVRCGHRALVRLRADIIGVFRCGFKVSSGRGPPTFGCAF
ncbi:hypothetical protein BXY51_008200 [Actinoplanes cyaneus]|nr:hypothetical protein [Actinoplanes cyaneus]